MRSNPPKLSIVPGATVALVLFARAAFAQATGSVDVSQGAGGNLVVTMVSTPDAPGVVVVGYEDAKNGGCSYDTTKSCYTIGMHAGGLVTVTPAAPGCKIQDVTKIAECPADSVKSVKVVASKGGTVGTDASGPSEMGQRCLPVPETYEVGGGLFEVAAHDGCMQTIVCAGNPAGSTLDVDTADVLRNCHVFTQRH